MTISPRPELLKEFRKETEKKCHFYKPFQLLNYASKYLGKNIKQEVIEEVENYQHDKTQDDTLLQMKLTLKGRIEDLALVAQEIKNAGYNIFPIYSETNNLHELLIALPNIQDLERRFSAKYISNLKYYNLELVSIIKR